MSNDLISREELKKAISGEFDLAVCNGNIMLMSKVRIVSRILAIIDHAPTVDTACPHCDSGYAQGYSDGYLRGKEEIPQGEQRDNFDLGYIQGLEDGKKERPQSERAERALAIIDRLRTDGHINNKEQGTLRRAILLPEKPQGEWIEKFLDGYRYFVCNKCEGINDLPTHFCENCGLYMRGVNNGK